MVLRSEKEQLSALVSKMTAPQKKSHQDGLARLVHDLKSTKTLCRVKDYPGVSVEQLNEYVKEHGPLVHPVVGEQPGFFVDEGRFIPFRKVVPGRGMIGKEISGAIRDWIRWSGHGGRVTDAQGEFMIDNTMLRIPDVVYIPRDHARQLTDAQRWTRAGEPFAPTFVVEIDTLTGPHSNLDALDHKMRHEYFPHGVQLGWLIDPKNKIMYEYKRYRSGNRLVRRLSNESWRDLDGGNVLPGFTLFCEDLDAVLDQEPGSSSDEAVDYDCPLCGKNFRSLRAWAGHGESHRAASARARRRANRANH